MGNKRQLKRYTVTLDAYVYAESDEEAKSQAQELAASLREKDDNRANVLTVHETPFGSLIARKIK